MKVTNNLMVFLKGVIIIFTFLFYAEKTTALNEQEAVTKAGGNFVSIQTGIHYSMHYISNPEFDQSMQVSLRAGRFISGRMFVETGVSNRLKWLDLGTGIGSRCKVDNAVCFISRQQYLLTTPLAFGYQYNWPSGKYSAFIQAQAEAFFMLHEIEIINITRIHGIPNEQTLRYEPENKEYYQQWHAGIETGVGYNFSHHSKIFFGTGFYIYYSHDQQSRPHYLHELDIGLFAGYKFRY